MNNPPVSVVFPADGNLHRLEIRLQAIQLSPYHAGPPDTPPLTTGPGRRVFWHALVPFTFSDPGQPFDPRTSLQVPPGCTGDTTERLAAHKVRSTAQRRGITANPCCPAGLRTICSVVARIVWAQSSSRPANPPSANRNRTRVRRRVSSSTDLAPSRSCTPAEHTTTHNRSPRVSVVMNRLRPL